MLKPSVKISSPVLRQTKLQHVKCRKFHLSSQTTFKTLAKSSTNLQKTIFSSTKTHNNKRWSSNSNSHAESGLEHQPAERYSYYIPNDVPPEKYAQYVSTDNVLGGLVGSGGAAFALALLLLYMQSDSDELAEQVAEELAAIKKSGQGLDADTTLQKLNTVHTVFFSATPDQQALFLEFATQILEHKANPKLVAPALDILRFALAKGIALPISSAELIHKFTSDQFIQEIPVQTALINLFNRATLTPSTRAAVANPILADYAELLMNHSEETVATKAAHVLLALARSREHVELLGGAVHTLWNIIVRNDRDEAVGYAKETLALIHARAGTSQNEQFKQTVESQIQQARIHPKALEDLSGYRNTHFFSGAVGSNLITAVVAAGWGLVRWHTQLARSGYHIDTPTARKIVSMRLAPTVVASLLLLNFAKMLNVDSPTKKSIVPEYPLLVFTAGMVASVAPFTVVPATVGYFWPKFATRKSIAKDSEYQY